MSPLVLFLGLLGFATSAVIPRAYDGPDPSQVTITSIFHGGTGCPQDTTASASITDGQVLRVTVNSPFQASIGPSISITEARQNCQVNLNIAYPAGWQYTIGALDVAGSAYIQSGITGRRSTNVYFSGSAEQTSTGATFPGPFSGNYLDHDGTPPNPPIYSKCSYAELLNVNTAVSLSSTNAGAYGFLSIDYTTGQTLAIYWRRC